MAKQLFTNNSASQLSGSLPQGATSLVCSAGEGTNFPAPTGGDFFYLTLYTKDTFGVEQEYEIVKVTERFDDVLTVVRDVELITGQAGGRSYNGTTTPVYLEIRWTAGGVNNMFQRGEASTVASTGQYSDLIGAPALTVGTSAALDVAASGDASTTQVVKGNDTRLTNARVPTTHTHVKADVGLGNVDNTADTAKPVSTAQASADAAVLAAAAPAAHVGSGGAAHSNVVAGGASGFMLGSDKTKLDGIATNANAYTHPANHAPSIITQDSSNRFVTDTEKGTWNAKGDVTLTGTQTLTNKTLTSPQLVLGGTNGTVGQVPISQGVGLPPTWGSNGSSSVSFPAGTLMLFVQSSAPTGWTKSLAHNNKALRIVSGVTGSGGSVEFTTAFASQGVSGSIANATATGSVATSIGSTTASGSISVYGSVGGTTLSTYQMPSHNHSVSYTAWAGAGSTGATLVGGSQHDTSYSGGNGSHDHGFYGSGSFSGNAHNHTGSSSFTGDAHNHTFTGTAVNLAVQYVDVIIAVKD